MVNKIRWNQVKELFNFSSELGEKNEHEAIFFLSKSYTEIKSLERFPFLFETLSIIECSVFLQFWKKRIQANTIDSVWGLVFCFSWKKKKDKIKRKLSVEVIVPHILIQAAQNKLKKKN